MAFKVITELPSGWGSLKKLQQQQQSQQQQQLKKFEKHNPSHIIQII